MAEEWVDIVDENNNVIDAVPLHRYASAAFITPGDLYC